MNDFASVLSTALHEEAKEIAMSADMQQAEQQLRESIRSADRRRRTWMAVAAAAAILVVAAGVALAIKLPRNQSTQPPPHPKGVQLTNPIPFSQLTPSMTVKLPHWVAASGANDLTFTNGTGYSHGIRAIRMFSVGFMYPLRSTRIAHPTYDQLVTDWKAVQTDGYGTVSNVRTPTLDGRAATTMTVRISRDAAAFAYCQEITDKQTDGNACAGVFHDRLMYVAIVDQGKTKPPTLLWESTSASSSTPDTASPSTAEEFEAWLPTVHFGS